MLNVRLETLRKGYDGRRCWVHARSAAVPQSAAGDLCAGLIVVTMQPLLVSGTDLFSGLSMMLSRDGGRTWSGPVEQAGLKRWPEAGGIEACLCDFTPGWHERRGVVLGTGQIVRYLGRQIAPGPWPRETGYSVFDFQAGHWDGVRVLSLPQDEAWAYSVAAGSTQRVDLVCGDILLPVYGGSRRDTEENRPMSSWVLRCAFDGERLTIVKAGGLLSMAAGRGLYEPSLAEYGGRYYLTLRNDEAGYVAASDDGLSFDEPQMWRFDDGEELGNYNTQQHWLRRGDGLYLVYTRRGLSNDHVFRHRAPLVMARVDVERLRVVRETEQVVVPQRGARLGNFAVTHVNDNLSLVTAAEWMQPAGCERYGSDNSVYLAWVEG